MKAAIALIAILAVVWLGLWISDTGVLVRSSDTGVLKTRDCRYFIGVTVLKRLVPLADRCPILKKVGG